MTVTPSASPEPVVAPPAPLRGPKAPRPTRAHTLGRHFLHASAPPRTFDHTGYADEATLALGAVVHLAHVPWPAVAGAGAAAVFGAGVWAHQMWQHRGITWFATGTATASGAWVTWGAYDTPWSIGSIAALVGGTLLLGPIYGICRWRIDKRNQKEIEQRAQRAEERAGAKRHQWVGILEDAGCPDITIDLDMDGEEWAAGERKFPAGFALALNLGKKAPDVAGLAQRIPEIEKIASGATHYPIRPGSIQVAANPERAHKAELIIPTRDVLSEEIPLEDRPGPRSCHDPIDVAVSVDGTVIAWDCHKDPHGMFSGQNNSGKTTYLNAHLYETTRSVDAVNWLAIGEKPVRGFAPWLKPFLEGKTDRPVIDWFAADLYEAWMMLLDGITLVQRRQESAAITGDEKWYATAENPEVFIYIDESPDFLDSKEAFPLEDCPDPDNYRGPRATFSQLLLKLIRIGRSEGVHVVFLTQRGTVSMLGAEGGDIKSQVQYRAGFRATGTIDANAVFNTQTAGINVESLPQGALYVELSGYTRPVLAKGMRLTQERIAHAAVEHAPYCGPIDAWSAEPLSYYHERWTRPRQQEFLRLLCPNAVRTVPGQVIEVQDTTEEPQAAEPAWPTTEGQLPDDLTVEQLEAMFAAASAAEPIAPTGQVRRIDPTLPEDTRKLLEAIAASDLLLSERYVLAADLLVLVEDLGWPTSETAGGRRIAKALKVVSVFKAEPRPRIDGKQRQAYHVEHLKAAVERNTIS